MSSSPRPPLPTTPWSQFHKSQDENKPENKLRTSAAENKIKEDEKQRKGTNDCKEKKERTKTSRLFPKAGDLLGFCIAHYTYPLGTSLPSTALYLPAGAAHLFLTYSHWISEGD